MTVNETNCPCPTCKDGKILEKLTRIEIGKPPKLVIGHFPEHTLVHGNYHCSSCGVIFEATENNGLLKYEEQKKQKSA